MKYTVDELHRILDESSEANKFIYDRIEEILTETGFLGDGWVIQDYDVDGDKIRVVALDTLYDLVSNKATSFPFSWICDRDWKRKWEVKEHVRRRAEIEAETAKAREHEQKVREQEIAEYRRLKAKYGKI